MPWVSAPQVGHFFKVLSSTEESVEMPELLYQGEHNCGHAGSQWLPRTHTDMQTQTHHSLRAYAIQTQGTQKPTHDNTHTHTHKATGGMYLKFKFTQRGF